MKLFVLLGILLLLFVGCESANSPDDYKLPLAEALQYEAEALEQTTEHGDRAYDDDLQWWNFAEPFYVEYELVTNASNTLEPRELRVGEEFLGLTLERIDGFGILNSDGTMVVGNIGTFFSGELVISGDLFAPSFYNFTPHAQYLDTIPDLAGSGYQNASLFIENEESQLLELLQLESLENVILENITVRIGDINLGSYEGRSFIFVRIIEVVQDEPLVFTSPWLQAYAEVLMHYAGREIGEYAAYVMAENGGRFSLHDFDHSGVPELIIWECGSGGFFFVYTAYAFEDGQVVPLEINRRFGGRGFSIYSPPSNARGIILTSRESGHDSYAWVTKQGRSLDATVSARRDSTPWQGGYDYSLYFVRGLDVAEAEYPDTFWRWRCAECCYAHFAQFGYVFVSEEDFYSVLKTVFGQPREYDGMWPVEITEANIRDISGVFR